MPLVENARGLVLEWSGFVVSGDHLLICKLLSDFVKTKLFKVYN